jgi:hypothetical protein
LIRISRIIFRKRNLCKSVSISDCFGQRPYIKKPKTSLSKNLYNQKRHNHFVRNHQMNLLLTIFFLVFVPFKLVYTKPVNNLLYSLRILNKCNNPNVSPALETYKGINLIYFFNKPCPTLIASLII